MHLQLPHPLTAASFPLLKRLAEETERKPRREMASKVASLLLLGLFCFQFATAQIVVDCCLRVSQKRLLAKHLVGYTIQKTGMGCDISATVFLNKKGMKLCVVPPEGNPWVGNLIKILDKKESSQH